MDRLKKHLLIFTRDTIAQQAIKSLLLQSMSFSFEIESAKLSNEQLEKNQFTHILLDQADISLSDVWFIRKNQKNAEIILITPNPEHSETHHFSHFGVNGFLKKPVADEDFISALDRATTLCESPETWWFSEEERSLAKEGARIHLTNIESLILQQLLFSDRRVLSKSNMIQGINRDPDNYNGFEMCLSRLQRKFSTATHGERLIRSVRNRGYCLAQQIRVIC